MTKASNAVTIAQNNADMASQTVNKDWLNLATSTIPGVVMTLGKLAPMFTGAGEASQGMADTTDESFGEMDIAAEGTGEAMDAIPIVAIISAIIIAVGLLYEAWTHNWGNIRGITMDVWNDVKPIFDDIGAGLEWIWNNVLVPFGEAWATIFNDIGIAALDAVNIVIGIFNGFIGTVNDVIKGINDLAKVLDLPQLKTFGTLATLTASTSSGQSISSAIATQSTSSAGLQSVPSYAPTTQTAMSGGTVDTSSQEALAEAQQTLATDFFALRTDLAHQAGDTNPADQAGLQQMVDVAKNTVANARLQVSALGGVPAYATGGFGIVDMPTLLLAGESGPEAISIAPLSSKGGGGGGDTYNVNVTIQGFVGTQADLVNIVSQGIQQNISRKTRHGLH